MTDITHMKYPIIVIFHHSHIYHWIGLGGNLRDNRLDNHLFSWWEKPWIAWIQVWPAMADALSPAGIPPCDAWLIAVPVPGRNRRSGELIKSMKLMDLDGLEYV